MFGSSLLPFVFKECHVLFMLFVFIQINLCQIRFQYQIFNVSFNSFTTGTTSGPGTAYSSGAFAITPGF